MIFCSQVNGPITGGLINFGGFIGGSFWYHSAKICGKMLHQEYAESIVMIKEYVFVILFHRPYVPLKGRNLYLRLWWMAKMKKRYDGEFLNCKWKFLNEIQVKMVSTQLDYQVLLLPNHYYQYSWPWKIRVKKPRKLWINLNWYHFYLNFIIFNIWHTTFT